MKKALLALMMIVAFAITGLIAENSARTIVKKPFFGVKIQPRYRVETRLEMAKIDSIIKFGETFLGKPYRYKVSSDRILDCSGYVSYIFSKFRYELPRSSGGLGSYCQKIDLKDVKKGDLLFFKGRSLKGNSVGHVTFVINVEGDQIDMMHSCSRGIIKERYNTNKYYLQRFLFAGRLPFYEELNKKPSIISDTVLVNSDTVRFIGVGDMMLGTNFPSEKYLPPNEGKDLLSTLTPVLSSADITFGNLEGGFLTGDGTPKKCADPSVCYAFKSPDSYINHYVNAGFDLLSIANNHIYDFGLDGANNTVSILKKAGINFAGLNSCPYTIFKKGDLTYGFTAFAPNEGTNSIKSIDSAVALVKFLNSKCDIVIVSFHGGAEGPSKTHITKETEIFLGENRGNPYKFAHAVIDAGADIVFGHGPHVTRAVDVYKDRFIIYSMGNFATYGRFNLKGVTGIAPVVDLSTNKKGEFLCAKIISIKQEGEGGPLFDEEHGALKEIIKLTKEDFPENTLNFSEDGLITNRMNKN